ncbi:unnamed protein product [Symbiodinium sp. CCMP2592]|nr:unnamed protein product [Symbiodinium sp. CCMP2592]
MDAFETLSSSKRRAKYDKQLVEAGSDDGLHEDGLGQDDGLTVQSALDGRRLGRRLPKTKRHKRAQQAQHPEPAAEGAADVPAASADAEAAGDDPSRDASDDLTDLPSAQPQKLLRYLLSREDRWSEDLRRLREHRLADLQNLRDLLRKEFPGHKEKRQDGESAKKPRLKRLPAPGDAKWRRNKNNIRGVYCMSKGGYGANVFIFQLVLMSPVVRTLQEALDFHMAFTQIRQCVYEQTEAGCSFPEALTSAVQRVDEERIQSGLLALPLYYYSVLSTRTKNLVTPSSRVLATALRFWTIANGLRAQDPAARLRGWNEAKPTMVAEAVAEREERKVRTGRRRRLWMALVQALRPKKEPKPKKHNPFQTAAMLKKRWGVHRLPPGIAEVCPFLETGAGQDEASATRCLRAVLSGRNGEEISGQPRMSLVAAQKDWQRLRKLQEKAGDDAVRNAVASAEMQAMTDLMMNQLFFN